ncbi:MAG: Ig-like domain-containing protein, partial [Bacteroidota bacterium]
FAGIDDATTWNFTTAAEPDTTAPSVNTDGFSPADNLDEVAPNTDLVITFDEAIQAGTGNIIITDGDGTPIEIDVTDTNAVTITGNTITINPPADLEFSKDYNVTIPAGVIEDLAGNPFAGIDDPNTWNFTTAAEPDTTAPSVDTTNGFAPVDDADDVAADTNLVITFDEPIQA